MLIPYSQLSLLSADDKSPLVIALEKKIEQLRQQNERLKQLNQCFKQPRNSPNNCSSFLSQTVYHPS